jgi:hypothetical protein
MAPAQVHYLAGHPLEQHLAINELHGDERRAIDLSDVVRGQDGWMVQC